MNIATALSDWYWNLSRTGKILFRAVAVVLVTLALIYVFFMPPRSVPMALPIADKTPAARAATEKWWRVFHADEVEQLPAVISELTAAHAASPPDPVLSSILSGAHLWRFITRQRSDLGRTEVIQALQASRHYGEEAVRLAPNDRTATAPSVVSVAAWSLNVLEAHPESNAQVHIDILERTMVYPAFAGFIQGWLLGALLPAGGQDTVQVELGYNMVLEGCASPLPLPDPPRFNKLIHTLFALRVWGTPVCYENVAAPHNIEGMFLAMGDSWLKSGDLQRAQLWYQNVKTAPNYDTWRYKELLEDRLAHLEHYRDKFIADSGLILGVTEPAMQFQSATSCGVCHTN